MSSKAWRLVSWPLLAMGMCAPLITNCGQAGNLPGAPGLPPGLAAAADCPDVSTVEAVEQYDFVAGFKLDVADSAKLKAGTSAAVELKGFADKVDADLKTACGNLANDLGHKGSDFKNGEDACKAALKVMGEVKGRMGAKAKIAIDIKPPECQASMSAMADCAGKCDATVKPGEAKVECEPGHLSGTCDAQCSGTCDLKASAKCDGTCAGSCDAEMKGSCGGKCDGKCDGKPSKAECSGTCEGKCSAHVDGTCKGQCGGSCKMSAAAKCDGQCTGKCTAEFKEPKCTGEMKPPQMSADCKAKCDAHVQAKAECTPASVGIRIEGAADAKAAEQYKAALEKNLPAVLKIAVGIGERGAHMAGNVTVVVEGLEGSVKGMVKGDATTVATMGGKLAGCLSGTFKGALDAAASLKANVNVSVEVKASASASGSASGGGKAG